MTRESRTTSSRPASSGGSRRMATLSRPIAGALRRRVLELVSSRASGTTGALSDSARIALPILMTAYAGDPMSVMRAASLDARVHNDACVPLTHWVCDGLAELDAIAVLLGCTRLGELDAAVASTLGAWQTHGGEAVPRIPRLAPAIAAVLAALGALYGGGTSGEAQLAVVASIVELGELMCGGALRAPTEFAATPLGQAVGTLRAAIHGYRDELVTLGAAIDRAAGAAGDRMAVALGTAARMHQVAVIAHAITGWIDRRGPATAAQARWRRAAGAIEAVFAGSLAGLRRLVPLPP